MTAPTRSSLLLPAVFSLALACSPADAAGRRTVVVTGSSTIAPLMSEIGKRFEELHPGVRVDVQSGGSSRGVADARQELADVGMVSRALKPDEADLHGFPIARDGVCVILNAENPVRELTDEQVIAIYTGQVTSWKEVGGPDAPITVVNKAEGRSTLELFLHTFQLKSADIHASVVIGDNEQGIKTVAGNPDAIGYVSVGSAEYASTHDVAIRPLAMRGVEATVESVRRGTFPLARELNLVTSRPPEGLTRELIEFARSPAVHDLVAELYFVPLE